MGLFIQAMWGVIGPWKIRSWDSVLVPVGMLALSYPGGERGNRLEHCNDCPRTLLLKFLSSKCLPIIWNFELPSCVSQGKMIFKVISLSGDVEILHQFLCQQQAAYVDRIHIGSYAVGSTLQEL